MYQVKIFTLEGYLVGVNCCRVPYQFLVLRKREMVQYFELRRVPLSGTIHNW